MHDVDALLGKLDSSRGPEHVGIIMDGNGRWAKQRRLPVSRGHYAGYSNLWRILDTVVRTPINALSLYSLSTKNIRGRSEEEIQYLFELISYGLGELLKDQRIEEHKLEVMVSGRRNMLPEDVQQDIEKTEQATRNNVGQIINFCVAYDGQAEIVDATKDIYERILRGEINIKDVDEETIRKALYAKDRMPDVDLVIRTGAGKGQRISGFMLWSASYAEMRFTKTLWPDFTSYEFLEMLLDFQDPDRTDRTFGKRVS